MPQATGCKSHLIGRVVACLENQELNMRERFIHRRTRLWWTSLVMCRGDRREAVFCDDLDKLVGAPAYQREKRLDQGAVGDGNGDAK